MKIFTIIFTFYLFALAIVPCGDKDDCKNQNSEFADLADNDHSDHDEDSENCSPFCVCACCGHSTGSVFYHVALYNLIPVAAQDVPIYNASFVSEEYLSIWQPPKIS